MSLVYISSLKVLHAAWFEFCSPLKGLVPRKKKFMYPYDINIRTKKFGWVWTIRMHILFELIQTINT